MDERPFPVLGDADRRLIPSVPWSIVAPHEAQAYRNHGGQSLERLAERGGLCLSELAAVLYDRPWRSLPLPDAALLVRAFLPAPGGHHDAP